MQQGHGHVASTGTWGCSIQMNTQHGHGHEAWT
jgi:hypothetical protein